MYIHMKVLFQDLSTKFLFLIVLKSGRLPREVFSYRLNSYQTLLSEKVELQWAPL
jgi:hypothetical protein